MKQIIKDYKTGKLTIKDTKDNTTIRHRLNIGFIGAGSFAQSYILPILKKRNDINLAGVANATEISANNVAEKFGFNYSTTNYNNILDDKTIDTVFITTKHDMHAQLIIEALSKDKNVFVEKPLCLNMKELAAIKKIYKNNNNILMVGFNRRFSPFVEKAKKFIKNRVSPIMLTYRINAKVLPNDHLLYSQEGSGPILSESCQFIDLINFFVGNEKVENIQTMGSKINEKISDENFNISISYKDGSIANIQYSSVGDANYSSERLEAFCDNSTVIIDNYKKGDYSRKGIVKKLRKFKRDIGHNNEINYFIDSIKNKKSLINFDELVKTTEMTIKVNTLIKS